MTNAWPSDVTISKGLTTPYDLPSFWRENENSENDKRGLTKEQTLEIKKLENGGKNENNKNGTKNGGKKQYERKERKLKNITLEEWTAQQVISGVVLGLLVELC